MVNNALEQLIKEGCPSIAYRVRKEIRQDELSGKEDTEYQNLIYSEPKVQKVLAWQDPDGYFGTRLHTPPSRSKVWAHEGCVRYLLEMGLAKENETLRKALEVMLCPGWGKECENSRAAEVFKYGVIRASLFAQAGLSDYEFVSGYVEDALYGFRCITEAENYTDLVYEGAGGRLIFKEGNFIPVIYHLRLLAFTESWRSEENLKMIELAYRKLYEWLPLPPIYYKAKSYPVAPLGTICWPLNQDFSGAFGFFWLHFYEMSARLGMLGSGSPFRKHFERLKEVLLKQNGSLNEFAIKKEEYIGWSGYSGMALEGDWKVRQQRERDFMFRVLLIDKYSNRGWMNPDNKEGNYDKFRAKR